MLYSLLTYSQNSIASFVLNQYEKKDKGKIKEIIETTTFFDSGGKTVRKNIESFNEKGNLKVFKTFNEDGDLVGLSFYEYDSLNRKIKVTMSSKQKLVGNINQTTIFEYDSLGVLKYQKTLNSANQLVNFIIFKFDDKNLVQMDMYDGEGGLIGIETANYNFEKNLMQINIYDANKSLISSKESSIQYNIKKLHNDSQYNENGDLIYYERDWDDNDNVCYTIDYQYDGQKNWTKELRYKMIKIKDNEYKNKKKDMLKTRKIIIINNPCLCGYR